MEQGSKYIAIKLVGLNYYIWFERENTQEKDGVFRGADGWGRNKDEIDVEIQSTQIEGRLYSNTPQL